MKKILFTVCFLALVPQTRAQYLLSSVLGMVSTANEGGYEAGITLFNDSPSMVHGLKAAWYLGDRFRLGYTVHYGSNVVNSMVGHQRYRLFLIETGGYLEYVHKSAGRWALSFPVNFNLGSLYVPETYVPIDQPNTAGYIALEPRVQLARPLLDWLSFSVAGGYRFVQAGQLYGADNPSLAGPAVYFSLVLGDFK